MHCVTKVERISRNKAYGTADKITSNFKIQDITTHHNFGSKNSPLTVEGVRTDAPQVNGEEKTEDRASSSQPLNTPLAPSPCGTCREVLCVAWLLSGLGGVELSEPLPRPSRKSFRLKDEELRLS